LKAWVRKSQEPDGPADQLRVLAELVETRGAELRRAYSGVLGLAYGFGFRRGRRRPLACVTFVVRRKRPRTAKDLPREGDVPKHLLVYCQVDGKPTLCAVPTDVEGRTRYTRLKAHSLGVQCRAPVGTGATASEWGIATAAVTLLRSNGVPDPTVYLMSCLHLVGMPRAVPANGRGRIQVCDASARPVGKLSSYTGFLSAGTGLAFDSALAAIEPSAQAGVLSSGLPIQRIFGESELPVNLSIRTVRGKSPTTLRAVRVRVHRRADSTAAVQVKYVLWPNHVVGLTHDVLVEYHVRDGMTTVPGDSGAPVVDANGRLVGMHIGGVGGTPIAFLIPAYELFNPAHYSALANSDVISLAGP